ncbi:MAG: response regulator [Deltaproteobacteria bacterium]|nr:response regulator [Deltaproteobacteria bacterium]
MPAESNDRDRMFDMEERLRGVERQLAEIQKFAHLGSWEWDIARNVVIRSDELCQIYGVRQAGTVVSYETFLAAVHADDHARVDLAIRKACLEGLPFSFDYRIVRSDGTIRLLHGQGEVVVSEVGHPLRVVGIGQDVTDRKSMEAQLLHAERMSSVGRVAGGVAHEINNPMTFVLANLELANKQLLDLAAGLEEGVTALDAVRQIRSLSGVLEEIHSGVERVRRIVRDLKTFSRANEERVGPVDVQSVIEFSLNMAGNHIRQRARLVRDFQPVPLVKANESRLSQVLVNLLLNAAEALPDPTGEGVGDHEVRVSTGRDGENVVIQVADTGHGIPDELQGRVFEPFFTTKPVGVGTGLGLSTCHGIVTSLGGRIWFESEKAKGARFLVSLPAAPDVTLPEVTLPEAASLPPDENPRETPGPVSQPARLLVVDDEPTIGTVIRRIMASTCAVTAVTTPREGLDLIAQGMRFDLILCDMLMPEINGIQFYERCRIIDEEQASRIAFMTGGSLLAETEEFLRTTARSCLEKPFNTDQLRAMVSSLIDRR